MLIKSNAPAAVARPRPKRGVDYYSGVLRAQRPVVDVYQRAGGLGDLAGETGIPAIDGLLDTAGVKLEQIAQGAKIAMALSAAGLGVSLIMLYRSMR